MFFRRCIVALHLLRYTSVTANARSTLSLHPFDFLKSAKSEIARRYDKTADAFSCMVSMRCFRKRNNKFGAPRIQSTYSSIADEPFSPPLIAWYKNFIALLPTVFASLTDLSPPHIDESHTTKSKPHPFSIENDISLCVVAFSFSFSTSLASLL